MAGFMATTIRGIVHYEPHLRRLWQCLCHVTDQLKD